MMQIFDMAMKDIKLIVRDRLGLFFIVVFPIMMSLFFGSMMTGMGGSGGSNKMRVAIVDLDKSEISKSFIKSLGKTAQLTVEETNEQDGRDSVRKGIRAAVLVLPKGFGETAGVFWNGPPKIQLGVDPSRQAEAAMMEGFIMQSIGELVGQRFQDPGQFRPFIEQSKEDLENSDMNIVQRGLMNSFLGSIGTMVDSVEELQSEDEAAADSAMASGMQFAEIEQLNLSKQIDPNSKEATFQKIRSGWDISFPQAMLWGVLSCVAGFAISIARERSMGTMVRLQVAPVSKLSILAGKGLACFITVLAVIAMLTVIGVLMGMRPGSYPKLAVASLAVALCFVGVMMVISVIGKTEQGVSGAGWGINMVMAMFGGCMIPALFMPKIIHDIGILSPVRWGIVALEGAIWRQFTWSEMMMPCLVMVGIGLLGLVVGGFIINRQQD